MNESDTNPIEEALDEAYKRLLEDFTKIEQDRERLFEEAAVSAAELETLTAEKTKLYQQLLRVSAEFDNFQKRTKKDKLQWTSKAVADVLTQFIPALDNLDSVLQGCDAISDPGLDIIGVSRGLDLVKDDFLKTLKQYNISKIVPEQGDFFDPELHCAISIQHAEVEKEVIWQVARPGYIMEELVLRPAEVIVSKNVYS